MRRSATVPIRGESADRATKAAGAAVRVKPGGQGSGAGPGVPLGRCALHAQEVAPIPVSA